MRQVRVNQLLSSFKSMGQAMEELTAWQNRYQSLDQENGGQRFVGEKNQAEAGAESGGNGSRQERVKTALSWANARAVVNARGVNVVGFN